MFVTRYAPSGLFLLVAFFAATFAPGCSCDDQSAIPKQRSVIECRSKHPALQAPVSTEPETIAAGALPVSFNAGDDGEARVSIPISTIPARGVEPELVITGFSDGVDGPLGVGFSLSAMSAITRCPRTMALDAQIESIQYTEADLTSLCLDGQRLVVTSQVGKTISYRLFVDQNVKVVGHFENVVTSYLEAFWPDGAITRYGATDATRPMATETQPRAWLATSKRNARGTGIEYGYCFAENDDGTVAEYALDRIDYGSVNGKDPVRSVALVYGARDDARVTYSHGLATQQSLRLDEMQLFGPDEALVKRYPLAYTQSESTGHTRLQSVQECAAENTCKLPTTFHYAKAEQGFEDVKTNIAAPLSNKASPMFFDVDHDGLPDYVVGDVMPSSTPEQPITEWRIAKNLGAAFAPEKVALVQDWSFTQNAASPGDPQLLQPELATSIRFNDDTTTDLFLHDVTGSLENHTVLTAKSDLTFEQHDTNIARPFPLQSSPRGLRNAAGAVHLADVTGDQQPDLISCSDHGTTPETVLISTWTLHVWEPNGFAPKGTIIDTLTGIPCGTELHTVDDNHDSITDLMVVGYLKQGGVPTEPTGKYDVHRRRSDGTWEVFDTELPTPTNGGRTILVDVNGDGLPDAIQSGRSDARLYTWMNTGKGFSPEPNESLAWDGPLPQTKYFHLAQPLDWDGDGRTDLLLPMVSAISPDIPRWVILRATGGRNGFTFEQVDTTIPFDAVLGDTVDIADPRGPRILDFDGNGAPDIAIFLGNELHVFRNRVDPDVLVGFSDGSNDHDPDEPGFVPNVSISYGHLTDDAKAKGQAPNEEAFYVSQSDPANDCRYPRTCVVGSKRVVSEYNVNDGQGGVRRFGVRYRDGRADRLHGFLGFGERLLADLDTGATTATFYNNVSAVKVGTRKVYPFAMQVKKQWRWAPGLSTQPNPDQVEMAFVDRTLELVPTNDSDTYFTLATKTHTRRMQGSFSGAGTLAAYVGLVESLENAAMLRDSTVEVLGFDEFHNVLELQTSTVGVDLTLHITRKVRNDVGKWMLGLPDTQTECSSASGLTSCRTITRTSNAFGEVDTEATSTDDGIADTKLNVVYDRDKFGNLTHVAATDAFGHKRESTHVYDKDGVFPVEHVNALGHKTTQEYDHALGVLTKQTDPNGLTMQWGYDSLGRLESETRLDGSQTTTTTMREKIDGVWRLLERSTTTGGADDETVLDSLGRPIATFTHGPEVNANTPRIMQRIEYDRLSGNVARKSVPIAEGTPDASLTFDEYEFDALGREIRHTTPWNAVTTTKYDGLLVEVTDPLLHLTKTELDPLGRTKTITDAANGKTKYAYGPFDALDTVTDPGNATTKWTRDAFLRVRRIDEPDRGTTTYVNDGFGALISSTDALGRVATYETDALGRTTRRMVKVGGQTLTTTWSYDTAPNGIGRLHSVVSPDGVKTYSYNKRGQTDSLKLGVNGDVFTARFGYDNFGRAKTLDYPQPLGMEPFGVAREYDAHGFVLGVRDTLTADAYWELRDVDEAGRYKEELLGNGTKTTRSYESAKQTLKSMRTQFGATTIQDLSYDWDSQLNLKSRSDALQAQNKTERFRYDALDRLTCAYFDLVESANAACDTTYGYSANGNLTAKSDVGMLSYGDPKHPHAVTNAAGGVYAHDAVGNQITRPGGVAITYTPFDLLRTITQNGKTVSYGYDGEQQRIRKTTSNTETLTFDEMFEQVTTGGVKEFWYYVHSPERVVAIVTRGGNAPGTHFIHVDHLGSTETITNADGTIDEKRSYNAFGQRRNVVWGIAPPASFASSKVKPGFTAHDEQDEFGLVNMRGRLLDPKIGRFTTTDPVIANVYNGQSFAAYSYVRNNPLAFVDPSGFTEEEAWRQWRFEETPGQVGVHVTFDKLTPRAPSPTPQSLPVADVDVNTMGAGSDGFSVEIPDVEPLRAQPSFGDGVWDGVVDMAEHLPEMVPDSHENNVAQARTVLEAIDAYKKGDAVDAANVVNPLMGLATLGFALDDEDWYTAGRASVGVGVTIVGAIVGKRLMGGAAREHHVMTNKNYVSSVRGGPWSPIFEDMAKKAGMTLEDAANKVDVPGHRGPHPEAYHKAVYQRLSDATDGLIGDAYAREFAAELGRIRTDATTPGSRLNQLITRTQ